MADQAVLQPPGPVNVAAHRVFKEGEARFVIGSDIGFYPKSAYDGKCRPFGRAGETPYKGFSLWSPHAIPLKLLTSSSRCASLSLQQTLPDGLELLFDRRFTAVASSDGKSTSFDHYMIVPSRAMTRAELLELGEAIACEDCVMKAAATTGSADLLPFDDVDGAVSEPYARSGAFAAARATKRNPSPAASMLPFWLPGWARILR